MSVANPFRALEERHRRALEVVMRRAEEARAAGVRPARTDDDGPPMPLTLAELEAMAPPPPDDLAEAVERDEVEHVEHVARDEVRDETPKHWVPPVASRPARVGVEGCAPEPLRRPVPPAAPYPMQELGDVLGPAAQAMRRIIQAPDAICGSSVLAAASLATQALADVHIDGRVHPLSLFILSIASSGERKSACDAEAMRAAVEFERELHAEYVREYAKYAAALEEWKARCEHARKGSAKTGGEGLADALMDIGPAPEPPMLPTLTLADFTAEGIAKLLLVGRPSIGAFTDEAALVLGGHGMSKENVQRTAGTLCKLWDAGTLDRVRAGDGAVKLFGRRFSLHLLGQPVIIERALADDILVRQGFLPRCLLCWPESTAGNRPYVAESTRDDPAVKRMRERILMLHRQPMPTGDDPRVLEPRALHLEPDAAELWRRLHDGIERGMRDGERYAPVQAWASKTPEQALRIAGVLALVDDPEARSIDLGVMERAAEIALWHLNEAARLVGAAETDPAIVDAEALLAWCHATSRLYLYSKVAMQRGPSRIRDRTRFLKAIELLEAAGWARREPDGLALDGAKRKAVWRIVQKEAESGPLA